MFYRGVPCLRTGVAFNPTGRSKGGVKKKAKGSGVILKSTTAEVTAEILHLGSSLFFCDQMD